MSVRGCRIARGDDAGYETPESSLFGWTVPTREADKEGTVLPFASCGRSWPALVIQIVVYVHVCVACACRLEGAGQGRRQRDCQGVICTCPDIEGCVHELRSTTVIKAEQAHRE